MAEYMVVPEYFILRLGWAFYVSFMASVIYVIGQLYGLVFIIIMSNIFVDRDN